MIQKVKTYKDLPFEILGVYKTKFQTGELFMLTNIIYRELKENGVNIKKPIMFEGVYLNCKHIGVCPLNIDRLIPEKIQDNEIEVCSKCLTPLK